VVANSIDFFVSFTIKSWLQNRSFFFYRTVFKFGLLLKLHILLEDLKPHFKIFEFKTVKGVLNPNFRPFSFDLKKKLDFLK